MAGGSGTNWRDVLWPLLKAALVAAIVALLVALGVTGLRAPYGGVGVMGVAKPGVHFTGPMFVAGPLTVSGALTATTIVSSSNGFASTNGFDVVGNITLTDGSLINTKGAVTVTDTIDLQGNVADSLNSLRLNDSTLITGTLGVSQLVTGADGFSASDGITSSGSITVTSWGLYYGLATLPATTCVVTTGYSITPGNYSLVYIISDGAQATHAITMSAVTSILSGTYQGQLLMIMCTEGDGAALTIKDNANTALTGDIQLGISDTLTLFWNGVDWVELAASNN